MVVCPSCGQENPEGFRFCGVCAAPLEGEPARSREERRVVTVFFCDLVGFTGRAERLDPEDVRELLAPYHTLVRAELQRFGGTVEKFIGDAVMALFGAPVAHEDDPERAVRAALSIRDWMAKQGGELQVRIAVNTGEALVALGARPGDGEGMASGDVVNTAARLQAAAPVNGILVGERTYRATHEGIEYRRAAPVVAKGKAEPVPVWEALAARSVAHAPRTHETPFVGRDRELTLLSDALARAVGERTPQLVTLVGVPGIGKTRLVLELEHRTNDSVWRRGRCLPYGDGVTFWALGEIVKAESGIRESDSAEQAEAKLAAAVDDDWVRSHLRPLVGLPSDASPSPRREDAFSAWLRFSETLAERDPFVLVLEDLHWADDDMLDFVDYLVEWATGVPLLVVATARPELLDRRRDWGGGKPNALTLSLGPLSEDETARIVEAVLTRPLLEADRQADVLAQAGGNPLYAEQLAHVLRERGDAGDLPLPETLQGIIGGRLDLLGPEERALLQDAAVLGKSFWVGAVAALASSDGGDPEQRLHALERRELVRRERTSTVEGEVEYTFPHLLVRDVAYGQLPRRERAEKHRLAAAWIEQLGRREDHVEMLAHHYLQALVLSRALGRDTTELADRAGRTLRDAGDRAMALDAYPSAIRFYERALDLWPPDDDERPELLFRRAKADFIIDRRRIDLLDEARDALVAAGDRARAAEAEVLAALQLWLSGRARGWRERADHAAAELESDPPSASKAFVLANRARLLWLGANPEEALPVGREALAMARGLGLRELEANALNTIGSLRVMAMDDFDGFEELEESLRLAMDGSPFELTRIYNNLAWAYVNAGRLDDAIRTFRAQVATAKQFGLPGALRWARAVLAQVAFFSGDWVEALRLAEDVLAENEKEWPALHFVRAEIRLARGELAGAATDCDRGLRLFRLRDIEPTRNAGWLTIAARIAIARGQKAVAEELVDHMVEVAPNAVRQSDMGFEPYLVWLLADHGHPLDAVLEAAEERPASVWRPITAAIARGELLEVADRLGELGALTDEAQARFRAARDAAAKGQRAEADEQLHRALAFYRSVGATHYIREAEALLAASV